MAPAEPSLFFTETISEYIPLAPASLNSARAHLCAERFSPLLLSYYPPVRGIVLSYSNVRLSTSPPSKYNSSSSPSEAPLLAKAADEYSASFIWATVDFLVYRLQKGVRRSGRVKVQTETHITLSHLNAFQVYVPREQIPKAWRWVENGEGEGEGEKMDVDGQENEEEEGRSMKRRDRSQGYYLDEEGRHVDERELTFWIRDFDLRARGKNSKGYVRIDGSLTPEGEQEAADTSAQAPTAVVEKGESSVQASMERKKKDKKDKTEKKSAKDKKEKKEKRKKDKKSSELPSQSTAIEVS